MESSSIMELDEKESILDYVYNNFNTEDNLGLTAKQLQWIHQSIRGSALSLRQIEKSMNDICACGLLCDREELLDILKEMDRRLYLAQDLQWEFALLDRQRKGAVSKNETQFLFQMVYGEYFSKFKFDSMIKSRLVPDSDITFDEVEVELCNIPTYEWIEELRIEEDREREEEKWKQEKLEIERKRIEEEKAVESEVRRLSREEAERRKKNQLEVKRLEEGENKNKEVEARLKKQEVIKQENKVELLEKDNESERKIAFENWKKAEDLLKEKLRHERMQALQEAKVQHDEEEASKVLENADAAMEAEMCAAEEVKKAQLIEKQAQSEEDKLKAIEARKQAEQQELKLKEKRLRISLKSVVQIRSRPKIDATVAEAEESELPALEPDIKIAKTVSDSILCGEKLENGMVKRSLPEIEAAVTEIKNKGYEKQHVVVLSEAEQLAEKLKKLEKLRREILALDQRTISEIRSYKTPIAAIHEVMIATYFILGYKEKELKEWKFIQALLGRSGKEGLKRMCTTLEASKIDLSLAGIAEKKYLCKHDIRTITDISAGAATFFVWSTAMIDEARSWHQDKDFRQRVEEKRKKEMEEAKQLKETKNKRKKKLSKGKIGELSNSVKNNRPENLSAAPIKVPGTPRSAKSPGLKSPASRRAASKSPQRSAMRVPQSKTKLGSPKIQRR